MEVIEIILLVSAYSIGIITLFLEFICYSRKIEYLETILFTAAFLLMIVSVSVGRFAVMADRTTNDEPSMFILVSMVLLSVTTPLNVFRERKFEAPSWLKIGLMALAGILLLVLVGAWSVDELVRMEVVISIYLAASVVGSMLLIRMTEPEDRVRHREKIERIAAVIFLCILPFSLAYDFFASEIPFLDVVDHPISLTLPLLFIFLAGSKLLDDINRLSIFKPELALKEQNLKNYHFTPREREVVDLIIKGCTYHQISEQLFISLPTVKTHVSNIYRKAQVNNKIGLIRLLTH